MKYCRKCFKDIDEHNGEVKWCMTITKRGQKIIEFESFHLECWKRLLKESIEFGIRERKIEYQRRE